MSENAYKAAGVDVEAGYESVRLIKEDVKKAINESRQVANEVNANDAKARTKQLRRDN